MFIDSRFFFISSVLALPYSLSLSFSGISCNLSSLPSCGMSLIFATIFSIPYLLSLLLPLLSPASAIPQACVCVCGLSGLTALEMRSYRSRVSILNPIITHPACRWLLTSALPQYAPAIDSGNT